MFTQEYKLSHEFSPPQTAQDLLLYQQGRKLRQIRLTYSHVYMNRMSALRVFSHEYHYYRLLAIIKYGRQL